MLLDGLHNGLVGDVDAEVLVQRLKHVCLKLAAEVLETVLVVLERNVGELAEEIIIVDDAHVLDGVKMLLLKMLLEAAGAGAGLGRHLGVKEVEAALKRTLQ